MRVSIAILLLILIATSCKNVQKHVNNKSNYLDDSIARVLFIKDSTKKADSLAWARWYQNYLKDIHEPALDTVNKEIYRFTYNWYLSRDIIFTIVYDTNGAVLYTTDAIAYFDGKGNYQSTNKINRKTKQYLSKKEVDSFNVLITKSEYWNIQTPNYDTMHLPMIDGGSIGFQSKSKIPGSNCLIYYSFSYPGVFYIDRVNHNFTNAFGYLVKISTFNKKFKGALYERIIEGKD